MAAGTKKIILRSLKQGELVALTRLWTNAGLPFRAKGRDSLDNLRIQRRNDPELFIGAFENGRMVGAAIASDDGRKAWINRLAVAPGARRRGIGAMLIRRCEEILRKRGRHIFCVHVESDHEESMELFEREGYHKEELIFYFTKRDSPDY